METSPLQRSRGIVCSAATTASVERGPHRSPLDDKYVWTLIWRQKRQLFFAGLALIFATACNLTSPIMTGLLFQMLVDQAPRSQYARLLGCLATLYIVEPLLTRVYISNMVAAGEMVLSALRRELFRILLLQRIDFFDSHSEAALTSLLSSELETVRSFVLSNVSRDRGLRAILESVGAVAVLFSLSWRLGPILACVVIATAAAAALYKQQTKIIEHDAARANSAMVAVASQTFSAITTVRSFAGEPLERERFGTYVQQALLSGKGFGAAKANLESLNRGAIHVSLLALYGYGGWLVSRGLMPLRVLLSAIGFTFSLVFASQGVVQSFTDTRRVGAGLRRIRALLDKSEPDPTMSGALPPGAWWITANQGIKPPPAEPYGPNAGLAAVQAAREGPLELDGVSFNYPLRPQMRVLQGINLELKRGTITALVGRSGAGKSTVAALLSRFYAPASGSVRLAGRPAREFTRGEWARAIALVSQEPVLFEGTIADNIGYGLWGHASQEVLESAARLANAHDFILGLPEGYDTLVGKRGVLLSGGQRQRIALARALAKDAPIIILDEATSALDAQSEKQVQQAIEELVKGRTVLVIAHRLSTVQAADQIAVLDGGQIIEQGTHEELAARGGLYSQLISSQSLQLSGTV
ncbi:hypothetical protein WJX73_005289 [Symbiochloris irregularis]|uniref:ABC transporter ATP-binding protein n=1 Tax=Symbiochloris irregularis TaxID=706552 RepID=A0AAW1NS95_9CHLO